MSYEHYYSRVPYPAEPSSALIGPFENETAARTHLENAVKEEDRARKSANAPPAPARTYQFFQCLVTVRPSLHYILTPNVTLEPV
jgi:hypothetical protein